MKLIPFILVGFLFFISVQAQLPNVFYQSLVDQVSYTEVEENLTELAGFGEKTLGSAAEENALNWMKDLYQSWGYTDIELHEVNAYGQTGYNLIVTKTGTLYPDTYIIVDGHYDTVNGPGANDNGSGTAVILETARILKDISTEYSIKFIHFTAEEWGLFGSYQYVEDIVIPQNLDIRLVFNIDQVGGVAGQINDTITCEQDESSPHHNNSESAAYTNDLMNYMETYGGLFTDLSYAYGSDYVPFQEEGFVITGIYEYNVSPYPHTPQDTLENLDFEFIHKVAKGTLGAVCHFAQATETMGIHEIDSSKIKIFPNPADRFIQVNTQGNEIQNVQLMDLSGRILLEEKFQQNDFQINTSGLADGIYILKISNGNSVSNQKIIVQHK